MNASGLLDPDRPRYRIRFLQSEDGPLRLKSAGPIVLQALNWFEVHRPGEEATQREIAAAAYMTPRTLRKYLRILEKEGLIETLGRSKVPPKVIIPEGYFWVEIIGPPIPLPKLFAPDDSPDFKP